jgi:chemotaxis protein methyltransferase CheR
MAGTGPAFQRMQDASGRQTAGMTDMLPTLTPPARPARPQATPLASDQEFSFSAADFERVRELIYQRAGISLHAGKQAMVYSRLSRRLRETSHRSFAAYLQWLQANTGASGEAEWQEFVNCLTTNLTAFFREEHHFHALVDDLKAIAGKHPGKPLRIWCSAASTGEEPYSIAITAVEALGSSAPVRIVASDIDTKVLATAQRGVYDTDARGLSPERLHRHFLRGKGANAGFMRVKPELAKLIEFRPFNLMSRQWAGAGGLGEPFDIIFCRNVMIYFDNPTQRQVLQQMHAVLKPGGLLYVGHSENFTEARELFALRGKTIYQRV